MGTCPRSESVMEEKQMSVMKDSIFMVIKNVCCQGFHLYGDVTHQAKGEHPTAGKNQDGCFHDETQAQLHLEERGKSKRSQGWLANFEVPDITGEK